MAGFDFQIDNSGELVVDPEFHTIKTVLNDDLRIQLAYNRIKSISTTWFYDNIGANLEELIGKPISNEVVNTGKAKIMAVLTFDQLWTNNDIYINAEITNAMQVNYSVYLRIFDSETEEESSKEINITLDLVKGVKIKYGWE